MILDQFLTYNLLLGKRGGACMYACARLREENKENRKTGFWRQVRYALVAFAV